MYVYDRLFQGTEVKAITYGSMKVYNDEEKGQHELFVIIDIWHDALFHSEEHSREMVMKRKNEDEEELDVSKAAKLDPPPEEVGVFMLT